jgi:predicted patatin/cPLA2 family phospholipase
MFIKNNFDLEDYIFSGASAGAWNSLFMCSKKNDHYLKHEIVDYCIKQSKNIIDIETMLKNRILEICTEEDFDLRRLFIGVTTIHKFTPNTTIFHGFNHLEDAINCCIASSHIPLITGGLIHKYDNMIAFDGGFSHYPYMNTKRPILHITPDIWSTNKSELNHIKEVSEHTVLYRKNKYDLEKLYDDGYTDAEKNIDALKKIFAPEKK